MKSKNIPADIKSKSIKEAQNEIKEILRNLEESFHFCNAFGNKFRINETIIE